MRVVIINEDTTFIFEVNFVAIEWVKKRKTSTPKKNLEMKNQEHVCRVFQMVKSQEGLWEGN
jgi:hypothetical protein